MRDSLNLKRDQMILLQTKLNEAEHRLAEKTITDQVRSTLKPTCVPWYLRDKLMNLNNKNYTDYWYNMQKESVTEIVDNEEICGFATQSM